MFHPLQPDLTMLSEQELEDKIRDLTKKYFSAMRMSPAAAGQIVMLLDGYKDEKFKREQKRLDDVKSNYNSDLDGLINIG